MPEEEHGGGDLGVRGGKAVGTVVCLSPDYISASKAGSESPGDSEGGAVCYLSRLRGNHASLRPA